MPIIGGIPVSGVVAGGAVEGSSSDYITTVTGTYTVQQTDEFVQCKTTAGATAYTVSLPNPNTMTGQTVRIENVDGTYAVTVNGAVTSYIRVAGKSTLSNNGSQVGFKSDGTYWNNLGQIS